MIADTNFLLRALDPEDRGHGRRARERLKQIRGDNQKSRIKVFAATVIEVAYVFSGKGAGYGYGPAEVKQALELILEEPALEIEHREALSRAADLHRESGIDFHDCYLAASALAGQDKVLSFDRDLKRLGVALEP